MAKKKKIGIKELKSIFEKLDNDKSKIALSLIEKAEFMEETLNNLQSKVKEDGVIVSMSQGTYAIDRENPALRSYNTTIKNYTNIMKQLNDMLPQNTAPTDDDFEKFGDDL